MMARTSGCLGECDGFYPMHCQPDRHKSMETNPKYVRAGLFDGRKYIKRDFLGFLPTILDCNTSDADLSNVGFGVANSEQWWILVCS